MLAAAFVDLPLPTVLAWSALEGDVPALRALLAAVAPRADIDEAAASVVFRPRRKPAATAAPVQVPAEAIKP